MRVEPGLRQDTGRKCVACIHLLSVLRPRQSKNCNYTDCIQVLASKQPHLGCLLTTVGVFDKGRAPCKGKTQLSQLSGL